MPSRENDSAFAMVDYPVRPHYLEPVAASTAPDLYGNLGLRVGEVVEAIYPDDPRSVSKRITEYRVIVQHLDEATGSATAREYAHCVIINPFGGLADRAYWTPRIDKGRERDDTGKGRGAKVLLLCVNGEHNSAVIIGGVRDDLDDRDLRLAKESGHSFSAIFNGVGFVISKDGAMSFVHNGPTKIDGTIEDGVADDVTSGFSLLEDGSVLLGAKDSRNDKTASQRIEINQPKRRIELTAGKGVHIGQASEKMAKFTTYRQAEKQLNSQIMAYLASTAAIVATCAEAFKATSTLHVIPIVGPILAAPAMGSIAVQFQVLMGLIQAAQQAINSFEAQGSTFESLKNTND